MPISNAAHTTSHLLGTAFSKLYPSLVVSTIILFIAFVF